MKIDVNIRIEVVNQEELQQFLQANIEDIKSWVMNTVENNVPIAPPEEPEEAPVEETEQAISLEDVRAKLGQLTKDGKQAQVKELIKKFGGSKLSDVPEDKYSDLLQAAGEL